MCFHRIGVLVLSLQTREAGTANQHTRVFPQVSDPQRQELKRWLRRQKTLRARIILQSAQGPRDQRVADSLPTTRITVGNGRRRFLEHGCDGLLDKPRSGAPRTVTDADGEQVVVRTLPTRPRGATQWSLQWMAPASGRSPSTIGRIWRASGLQPHRSETCKPSQDLQLVQKVGDIVGLYLHPPERAVALCVDEKSQIQALDRTQPVLPMQPGVPERHTHDYQRNGTTSLFAALNIATGEGPGKCYRRHRAVEFKKFLVLIDKAVPETHDVHRVLDNYGTHKTAQIQNWPRRRPRYHLHFIPTSASWLNQVERWFAEITRRRIRRGTFRSTQALEAAIREYLQVYNEDPQPLIWTKSADDILKSLQSYCEGFSGEVH